MATSTLQLAERWAWLKSWTPAGAQQKWWPELGATPSRLVFQNGLVEMHRYVTTNRKARKSKVFLIPSLINRHYVLDLAPGKSLVDYLLKQGHSVDIIRWRAPEAADQQTRMEDVLENSLRPALVASTEHCGGPVSVFGQCLGGTFATMLAVRWPELCRNLILVTAPVDFASRGSEDNLLMRWTQSPQLDLDLILRTYGNMPWPLLQSAFHLLTPTASIAKLRTLKTKGRDLNFLRHFLALETWSGDNVPYPGECFRFLIQNLYRENQFVTGQIELAGQRIALADLKTPVLSVASSEDHIVAMSSTLQKHHLNAPQTLTQIQVQGGHVNALLGSRSQSQIWPQFSRWISPTTSGTHIPAQKVQT